MTFLWPIQWYHSHADPIQAGSTFKKNISKGSFFSFYQLSVFFATVTLSSWEIA
jgi:hypothetical protein